LNKDDTIHYDSLTLILTVSTKVRFVLFEDYIAIYD